MNPDTKTTKTETKQRLTAFVDPVLVKRAKVRGALEGLTISEVVEKALDAYAPLIEKRNSQQIHVKFVNYPVVDVSTSAVSSKIKDITTKHTKSLVVPR